jgi:hypothetical protein
MIVFWSMVGGAGIMFVGVLFGVVIADVTKQDNKKSALTFSSKEDSK